MPNKTERKRERKDVPGLHSMRVSLQKILIAQSNGDALPRRVRVEVRDLVLDPDYQRRTSMYRAKNIARNWVQALCDDIVVAHRDGAFFVVDGGHRVFAMRIKKIKTCWAKVLVHSTQTKEAVFFAARGTSTQKLKPADIYHCAVTAKEPIACGIQAILDDFKLIIPRAGGSSSYAPNHIFCVNLIEKIWIYDSGNLLRHIIEILTRAWDDAARLRKHLFAGLFTLFTDARWMENGFSLVDSERLIATLSKRGPLSIISTANSIKITGGIPLGLAAALAILTQYNKQLRSKRLVNPLTDG